MHPAALPGGLRDLRHRGFQALVVVGDDQLHPTQAPTRERAQEVRPERLGFRSTDGHPEDFALTVGAHRDGDYHGHRDDPPGLARLHVGRVDPHRYGQSPSIGRFKNAPTRSSISAHSRETWLLLIPLMPIALTSSSTERVDTPWTYWDEQLPTLVVPQ